jgi:exodeoxyribonuclease VII large subunit
LSYIRKVFKEPEKQIEEYFLRVDDLVNRFRVVTSWMFKRRKEKCLHLNENLLLRSPIQKVKNIRLAVREATKRLGQNIRYALEIQRQRVGGHLGKLDSLNPLSILQRGYSITRKLPSLHILRDAGHVKEGDKVEVRLYRGVLICGVEKTERS